MKHYLKKLRYRVGDLELMTCGDHLQGDGEHTSAMICRWYTRDTDQSEFSCSIAYWVRGREGYNLEFVGGRPTLEDPVDFMRLVCAGQEVLDAYYTETCDASER